MTPDVNHADTDYLHDLLHLLRGGLQAGDLAERVSRDPWTLSVAMSSVHASRREITEVASCLDEWELAGVAEPRPERNAPPSHARTGADEDDLEGRSGADFDAHFTRGLLAHHHAVIDRSRRAVVEGLGKRSRRIAVLAISEHSAGLSVLATRSA